MIDAKCPCCGSPGPHPVVTDQDPARHVVVIECRDCYQKSAVEVD